MRVLFCALAVMLAISSLANCGPGDLDPSQFPDAWWQPKPGPDAGGPLDAARPDAHLPGADK
jgi:predicted small lipoprotein YifL